MKCPICNTINPDDRNQCFQCSSDLSILRVVILKSKEHYNKGLELAERNHLEEAIAELKTAVALNHEFPRAHNVLGTLYAKLNKWDLAIESWQQTLNLDSTNKKAAEYLHKAKLKAEEPETHRQWRFSRQINAALAIILGGVLLWAYQINTYDRRLQQAEKLLQEGQWKSASQIINRLERNRFSHLYRIQAKSLNNQLDNALTNQKNLILSFVAKSQYESAWKELQKLQNTGIPVSWSKEFESLQNQLMQSWLEASIRKEEQITSENKDYWKAKETLTKLIPLPLTLEQKKVLSNKLSDLRIQWFQYTIDQISVLQQKNDYPRAASLLQELQKESWEAPLESQLKDIKKQILTSQMKQQYRDAIQLFSKKKYPEFISAANQIDQTYLSDTEKSLFNQQLQKANNSLQQPKK